jgi:hypothetical protein
LADQGSNEHCCQSADDETLEGDPEQFDCDNCPLTDAFDDVWPENVEAWSLYKRMCSRFTYDFHAVPVLLQKAVEDRDAHEAIELTERLAMIYDTVNPPPKKKD